MAHTLQIFQLIGPWEIWMYPLILVKSLTLIWRWSTSRWNLWVCISRRFTGTSKMHSLCPGEYIKRGMSDFCENGRFCYWVLKHWDQDKMTTVFQTRFSNAFSWMKMYEFWLKFPEGPINNIPALVEIMAWCPTGNKPLSEAMVA